MQEPQVQRVAGNQHVQLRNGAMIRYSHVGLFIVCDETDVSAITEHLGCAPTKVDYEPSDPIRSTGLTHTWRLDSPQSHSDGDPTARLEALLNIVEPFGDRLKTLDPRFSPWVDILFHVTPQRPHGVSGEFDWFRLPAPITKRLASLNLGLSYETIWLDHPDWKGYRRPWWTKLFSSQ